MRLQVARTVASVTCSQWATSPSELGHAVAVEGEPLEDLDRRGLVGDADDEDAHAVTSVARSGALRCSW